MPPTIGAMEGQSASVLFVGCQLDWTARGSQCSRSSVATIVRRGDVAPVTDSKVGSEGSDATAGSADSKVHGDGGTQPSAVDPQVGQR
jgi:hypothetical protein